MGRSLAAAAQVPGVVHVADPYQSQPFSPDRTIAFADSTSPTAFPPGSAPKSPSPSRS
ncbi:hypothetical protein [Kitasatospora cineracea]|uniref:Uncharacterized protein n=1 Tax=Kitasatospora cineracea TaxID=88074 RepID=A0A8G1XEX7_9ACTN|nr:hypothetical protein [Kitasatospora cineracea]ROR45786.1 hypothetical protein EDD39_4033 [Kitasatospora cineracea]